MDIDPRAERAAPQVCLAAETAQETPVADRAAQGAAIPLANYIPKPWDPLKIVCVNFHIFQDAQGQGNFQPSENARLRQVIDWVNDRFTAPSMPNREFKPKPKPPGDTRIRFKIHRIEHYQIPDLHQLHIPSVPPGASAAVAAAVRAAAEAARKKGRKDRQAAAVARDPSLLNQLNLYVSVRTEDGGGYAVMPEAQMALDSNVVFVTEYFPQGDPFWPHSDFGWSMLVGHELGHCLDLAHTFPGGGASPNCNAAHPDFLADVFGTSPNTCPHDGSWSPNFNVWPPKTTNNLLGGSSGATWISALQAAMMQRALTEKSIRKYVATGCHDCASCVAFAVSGQSFTFKGIPRDLVYSVVELNETWGWNGAGFVAPVRGIYHFDLDFRMEGALDGDVVRISRNRTAILALAPASQGATFGVGGASFTARLERGDTVGTVAESRTHFGKDRTISAYRFSGHLVCGCP